MSVWICLNAVAALAWMFLAFGWMLEKREPPRTWMVGVMAVLLAMSNVANIGRLLEVRQ